MQGITAKGFFRVGLYDADGNLLNTPEWIPNVVTAAGFRDYICASVGSSVSNATAMKVQAMAFGSSMAAVSSTNTAISGEMTRLTAGQTFSGNGTLECVATWASGGGNTGDVGSVGLFNSTTAGTACACLAAFASSAKQSDQSLAITYQLRFASA